MIDNDPHVGFQFASADPQPTAIVELGERTRLRRITAQYRTAIGTLDFFLLDKLRPNPGDLSGLTPAGSLQDGGEGKAGVSFDPRGARYIALRWTPGGAQRNGFEITELKAVGESAGDAFYASAEVPNLFADSGGIRTVGEQGSVAFAENRVAIGTLPVVPVISP